jgi:hypothetical protein
VTGFSYSPPPPPTLSRCPRCGRSTGVYVRDGLELVCRSCEEGTGLSDNPPSVGAGFSSPCAVCSPPDGRYCPDGRALKLAIDRAQLRNDRSFTGRRALRILRRKLRAHFGTWERGVTFLRSDWFKLLLVLLCVIAGGFVDGSVQL